VASASPSTRSTPTAERQMRGPLVPPRVDDAHFRPHWSAVDPVERLFDGRLISVQEKAAASRFRATYDLAFSSTLRAHSWDGIRASRHCGRPAPLHSERQADALDRLAQIRRQLGAGCFAVLEFLLIMELPFAEIGRRLRRCPRTAKTRAAAALAALAAVA
jgi:Domain of unknown function (DUF6456)